MANEYNDGLYFANGHWKKWELGEGALPPTLQNERAVVSSSSAHVSLLL